MLRIFLHSIGCQTGEENEDYSVNKECFSKISVVITLFRAFRLLNIGISFRVIRPGLVNLIILSYVPNWYCVSKAGRSEYLVSDGYPYFENIWNSMFFDKHLNWLRLT